MYMKCRKLMETGSNLFPSAALDLDSVFNI